MNANTTLIVAGLALCWSCEGEPKSITYKLNSIDVERTSFIDLRGRVSFTDKLSSVPSAVRDSAFAPTDFPGVLLWTGVEYEPQFVIRQRAHSGWSGVAMAHYVMARSEFYRPRPKIEAFEKAELDPNFIGMQRLERTALSVEPTWSEFVSAPIAGVVVVPDDFSSDALKLRGGIQVLQENEGVDWMLAAEKETRKSIRLPLFVNANCIVSNADKSSIATCLRN